MDQKIGNKINRRRAIQAATAALAGFSVAKPDLILGSTAEMHPVPPEAIPDGKAIVQRRHIDWLTNEIEWRWLYHSFRGGTMYRNAEYGLTHWGYQARNLFRKHGELLAEWEFRLARTPVPEFMSEAIDNHLYKVYSYGVTREGPPELMAWWKDTGVFTASIDSWMKGDVLCGVAPMLMAMGCLDICVGDPSYRSIGHVIVPFDMLWWRLNKEGRYLECLVRELRVDNSKSRKQYRYWTAEESIVFSEDGEFVCRDTHNFGRVPIVRLTDGKDRFSSHVGRPRYRSIAEMQREYYNRQSDLILADTVASIGHYAGPVFVGDIHVGPGYVLPTRPEQYQGLENCREVIRAESTANNKIIDSIARSLYRAEGLIAEYVMLALKKPGGRPYNVRIAYNAIHAGS